MPSQAEKGGLPQVLCCPWRCPPVSRGAEGRAKAGAAAAGALRLQTAGGAGQHVLFPHGPALSSCHEKE